MEQEVKKVTTTDVNGELDETAWKAHVVAAQKFSGSKCVMRTTGAPSVIGQCSTLTAPIVLLAKYSLENLRTNFTINVIQRQKAEQDILAGIHANCGSDHIQY